MRFDLGNENYFSPSLGLIPAGTENFELPDGEQPSRRWHPRDDEAKAAILKLRDDVAKRKELRAADVRAMTPERLEQLVNDRVAQVLAAQQRAGAATAPHPDPKKSPKKDEPARGKEQASPL